MNPHREPPTPCGACAEREETLAALEPFERDPACPACTIAIHVKHEFTICNGEATLRLERYWFKKNITHRCELTAIPHFHMHCGACEYRWIMATALENKHVSR